MLIVHCSIHHQSVLVPEIDKINVIEEMLCTKFKLQVTLPLLESAEIWIWNVSDKLPMWDITSTILDF